jgi:hypothetical protein
MEKEKLDIESQEGQEEQTSNDISEEKQVIRGYD